MLWDTERGAITQREEDDATMPTLTRSPRRRAATTVKAVELTRHLGERLRSLRRAQDVTLLELAKLSGVDAATISRIETGRMTGTLESHLKLARALGAKLTDLYEGLEQAKGAIAIQAPSARTEVYVHQAGRSSMAMLTTEVLKKKLMPLLITIEPGGSTHQEEAKVGTEKFLYVLEGELEARIGEDTHTLKRGATLYFDASLPHTLRNTGAKTVRCLAVTTPPVL